MDNLINYYKNTFLDEDFEAEKQNEGAVRKAADSKLESSNYSEGGHGHIAKANAYDLDNTRDYRGGSNSGEDYGRYSRKDFDFDNELHDNRETSNSHWNQQPAHIVGETYQNFEDAMDEDELKELISIQQSGSRDSSALR